MAEPNEVGLRVNGSEHTGWKSASVTRSIEALAPGFDLTVWDDTNLPINEEDECVVVLGNDRVCVGIVDTVEPTFDSLRVSGRDALGDLVDCSADLGKWEFTNQTVAGMVKKVCAPFRIAVSVQSGLTFPTPPAKFSIDPGDTAYDVIERACRLAGVLAVSDGRGGLLLMRPGTERAATALVQGENLLPGSRSTFDATERFSTYKVLGQHRGSDDFMGASAARVTGTARDANVRRSHRVRVIRPEGNVTAELAKKRAQWEATVRAARGDAATLVVQGWRQGNGQLWAPGLLVPVKAPKLRLDGDMLITQVRYSVSDDSGTTTEISVKRPDAFAPEPTITTKSTGLWKEIAGGV